MAYNSWDDDEIDLGFMADICPDCKHKSGWHFRMGMSMFCSVTGCLCQTVNTGVVE